VVGGIDTEIDSEDALEHGKLPDPEGQAIDELTRRVAQLEGMVRALIDEKTPTKR